MDPHAVPQAALDNLLERARYFIGWGNGFVDSLADTEAVRNENYLQKKLRRSMALGLFDNFVDTYQAQIINIGHFVADNEFYWGTLVNRKYDAAVPGSRYARRQGVLKALRKLDGIRLAGFHYRYAFQIAERLSLGLESLGFRDGANCLFVQNATDVVEATRSVVEDVSRFDKIAAAGRDLVFREHSTTARGLQLCLAIERIEAGTFRGSTWRDGQFQCVGE